ncbi:MAG: phage holin family protein [Anaerolineales bacterium]
MTKLILRWAINAIALWVAITYVPGIHAQGGWPAILGLALIFGLVNALLRPLLEILTCPFIILTLGLGVLLINALLFWLTGLIGQQFGIGFTVDGFWPAFFGALVVSVISIVLSLLIRDEVGRRPRPRRTG